MVAYEPVWAIGAAEPAARELIMTVCASIADWLSKDTGRSGSLVLYGGSAGPGLLELLGDVVNGLFLGRSVHDPEVLETIVRDLDQRT
jgi:triosephosphate isomerase